MNFLLPLVIGVIVGGAGVWLYLAKKKPSAVDVVDSAITAKLQEGLEIVDSLWAAAFGPVGVHQQVVIDLCNKLWKWAGKSEKGKP